VTGGPGTRALPFALFGATPTFARPRSTSTLAKPKFARFMELSRASFDEHHYTNQGPANRLLEERLAAFHSAKYCISFCSGFWALVVAAKCLALPGRSEVLMPALTYRRMADAVAWAGLTPSFCDIDPGSLSATPQTVQARISERTALILAAHPVVNVCDGPGLAAISASHGIPLLIDSVESTYEVYGDGSRVGTLGNAELFSLHASKLVNGFEGGYVTTADPELADRLAVVRGFGFRFQDRVEELGTNAKLNDIHAAMALASLESVAATVAHNREIYDAYREALSRLPGLRILDFNESERPAYRCIVVEIGDAWPLSRARTIQVLNAERALARAYYAPALHQKRTGYAMVVPPLPVTDRMVERFMLLPAGCQVDAEDVGAIVGLLRRMHDCADELARSPEGTAE
jgi:dTDP-4-amino-4,6-dideoxygalactose transaminase